MTTTIGFALCSALFLAVQVSGQRATPPGPGGVCPPPGRIAGFAEPLVFSPRESPVKGVSIATYTCANDKDFRINGDNEIFCKPDNTWTKLTATCELKAGTLSRGLAVSSGRGASPRPSPTTRSSTTVMPTPTTTTTTKRTTTATTKRRTTKSTRVASQLGRSAVFPGAPCSASEDIDTFDCSAIIAYRYNADRGRCRAVAACIDTAVGTDSNIFSTKESCMSQCSPDVTGPPEWTTSEPATTQSTTSKLPRTTTTTTAEPTTEPWVPPSNNEVQQEKSGGSRKPSCLPGVPSNHSSCLENSPYLLQTIPFVIAYAVEPHNLWRQFVSPPALNMPLLEWHSGLAITAERYATQCPVFGEDEPSQRQIPGFGYIGQSMCFASGREKSWKDCITEWASQHNNWDYNKGAVDQENENVKNYVQMIWGQAKYVGCGTAQCVNTRDDYVMICNYGAPNAPGGPLVTANNPNPYARPYVKDNSNQAGGADASITANNNRPPQVSHGDYQS